MVYAAEAFTRNSIRFLPPRAKVHAPIPPGDTTPFKVLVHLRRRTDLDVPPLQPVDVVGASPPLQRKYFSRAEFHAFYGASPADAELVKTWAGRNGLYVTAVQLGQRAVILMGTAANLNLAFNTTLYYLIGEDGKQYRGHVGTLSLPEEVAQVVIGVTGLDERQIARHSQPPPKFRRAAQRIAQPQRTNTQAPQGPQQPPIPLFDLTLVPDPVETYFSLLIMRKAFFAAVEGLGLHMPSHVAKLYDFPGTNPSDPPIDGSGQCIALIELQEPGSGSGFQMSDLLTYFNFLLLTPAPMVMYMGVLGCDNTPGINEIYDNELAIDLQVAAGAAPGATYVLYYAPWTAAGMTTALLAAIHEEASPTSIVSCSFSLSEGYWLLAPMDMVLVEEALTDAVYLGVTVLSSSGDYGAASEYHDGRAWVDYPASSPLVLGCGGTALFSRGDQIVQEVAWNTSMNFGQATGGGVSQVFPLPAWQRGIGVPKSINPGGGYGRGVPDIAGEANPSRGYIVMNDGGLYNCAGTSSTAPLMAALFARINQSLGVNVGYVNPYLYARAPGSGAFFDIVEGDNNGYCAGPGWDACTGWGRPIGRNLLTLFKGS